MMKQWYFHAFRRSARWLVIMPVAVVSAWLAADRGHTAAIMGPSDAGPREVLFTYVARLPQIPPGPGHIRTYSAYSGDSIFRGQYTKLLADNRS